MNLSLQTTNVRTATRIAGALLALGVTAWSQGATAQQAPASICFPVTASVPFESGPPTWYTATTGASAGASTDVRVNEPRWSSSPLHLFANDGTVPSNGGYRIVASPDFSELTVSIQNTRGYLGTGAEDVYLAFYIPPPAGSTAIGSGTAVRIQLALGTSDPYFITSNGSANVTTYTYQGGTTWMALSSTVPTWVEPNSIASWTQFANGTPGPNSGGADWAIQFKVELGSVGAGIGANTNFKMAIGMHMANGADVTTPAIPGNLNPVMIPNTTIAADPTSTTIPWASTVAVSQSCPNGIGFDANNSLEIGTLNPDSSNIDPTNGAQNSFYANPTIPANFAPFPANSLRATFQIASWGAQPLATPAPWTTISGLGSVPNIGSASYVPGTNNLFQQSCPMNSGGNVCGAPLPSGNLGDQCMLVSLSLPPGHVTGPAIGNASMYRNMHFGTLSTKDFPADITVKGLQGLTGNTQPRDVYLNIALRNMPPLGNIPVFLDSTLMNLVKSAALDLISLLDPWSLSLSASAQMKMVWPTYEAHVFFDTGRINKIDGVSYHVLTPMNSFGYYLSHDGPLFGFTTAIGPVTPAVSWTKLDAAGTQFKVRVPNEGTVRIQSGVTAEEIPQALVPVGNRACEIWPWACQ